MSFFFDGSIKLQPEKWTSAATEIDGQFSPNMIRQGGPPQRKNTNPPPSLNQQTHLFYLLPDQIAENILARISKWKYPSLSLVSKRFLSLLSSPEIYTTRSRIGTTEPCLYFCFEHSVDEPPKWFTLKMKSADETLTDDDDQSYHINSYIRYNGYSLVPVPSPGRDMYNTSTVAVGSDIYVIGGSSCEQPSSAVRILDCRSHTWRDGPSMLVARRCPIAVFLDEKIYVMGDCEKDDTWMEVLDIKTKTWSPVLTHRPSVLKSEFIKMTFALEEKIYTIADMNNCAYDTKEGTWEVVEMHNSFGSIESSCMIEDVTYCYTTSRYFIWYDAKSKKWIDVKGSDLKLVRSITSTFRELFVAKLLNYGGKLLVMWVRMCEDSNRLWNRGILCATVALEKRHGNEVWGKVEWPCTVLTVSESIRHFSSVDISV